MQDLLSLRERYGSVFVTETPDGLTVPFKLLSLKDYLEYSFLLEQSLAKTPIVEDEIFRKCVTDSVLVKNIDKQKAGTIAYVAGVVLRHSAPESLIELNQLVGHYRNLTGNVLYQVVCIITIAFPSYTPDCLLEMSADRILFLLALAERKLLEMGHLKEPLLFEAPRAKKERVKPKIDVGKLKEEFDQHKKNIGPANRIKEVEVVAQSPDTGPREVVISGDEMMHALDTDPTTDSPEERIMLQEAKELYRDYLTETKKGERIKVKPVDVRIQEAKERMESNRKRLQEKLNRK
jgi:hypothetical protein